MKFTNRKIEILYEYLSRMSRIAYKDHLLISNNVFSKQESSAHILEAYVAGEPPPKVTFLIKIKKLVLYFVKNILGLMQFAVTTIFHWFSGLKFEVDKKDELILLDIYFVENQILGKDGFKDIYFPGLSKYLKKTEKTYAFIPRWFGSKRPLKLLRVFRKLRKKQVPVLTPYQVLGVVDYLRALRFVMLYPFSVFRFMKTLGSSYEDKLLGFALWDVFDGQVVENYIRFLFGQRLSLLVPGRIKCISWYENVPAEKMFYFGLRTLPEKTEIIGAQLFVRPNTLMNLFPDVDEIPFKVIPDKILVNGPSFRFNLDQVPVEVGPSLRYKYLFNSVGSKVGGFILVVMPYWDHVTNHVLSVIREVDWPVPVKIKFHPTMNWEKYKTKIPEKFSVTTEPLPSVLPGALMVVGHSTGALVEAAALGIPVIDILCPKKFSHDYTPESGNGVIWGQADNSKDVGLLIKNFQETLKENPKQLEGEGREMRSFCFAEPTEELMRRAFELD